MQTARTPGIATMEFHVARDARDRYRFDYSLYSITGNIILANFHAARVFAQRIMQEGGDSLPSRFAYAYRVALTRPPTVEEQKVLSDIYEEMLNTYQQDPKLADELISIGEFRRPRQINEVQLAAWTAVAQVILNLNETLTKQ